MERLPKEQIQEIGKAILQESDVVAKHGTSIKNGFSILETGFNFHRTSMVIQESDDIISLCTYGWKENAQGDAANIIISIPREFYMLLLSYNEESYQSWIKYIKTNRLQSILIDSVSDFDFNAGPIFTKTIPREFIRGMFIYTDNKNYLSFSNSEEGMDYLTYIDNQHYFANLNEEEKREFVAKIRNKLLPDDQTKSFK